MTTLPLWAVLKSMVLAELARGASTGTLAEATGLPRATIEQVLSPKGPVPSRRAAEVLQGSLDHHGLDRQGVLPANRLNAGEADRLIVYLAETPEKGCPHAARDDR